MAWQAYGFVPGSSFFSLFPFVTLCRTGQQYTQGKELDGIGMVGRRSQTGQKWDDAVVLNESVQTIANLLGHLTFARSCNPTHKLVKAGRYISSNGIPSVRVEMDDRISHREHYRHLSSYLNF